MRVWEPLHRFQTEYDFHALFYKLLRIELSSCQLARNTIPLKKFKCFYQPIYRDELTIKFMLAWLTYFPFFGIFFSFFSLTLMNVSDCGKLTLSMKVLHLDISRISEDIRKQNKLHIVEVRYGVLLGIF